MNSNASMHIFTLVHTIFTILTSTYKAFKLGEHFYLRFEQFDIGTVLNENSLKKNHENLEIRGFVKKIRKFANSQNIREKFENLQNYRNIRGIKLLEILTNFNHFSKEFFEIRKHLQSIRKEFAKNCSHSLPFAKLIKFQKIAKLKRNFSINIFRKKIYCF